MDLASAKLLLAVLVIDVRIVASRRYSEQKIVDLMAAEEESELRVDANTSLGGIDAEAFTHGYLTGFYLQKEAMQAEMVYSGPSIAARLAAGFSQPKWYQLTIGGLTFFAGQPARVTRQEIVPKASEKDVATTESRRVQVKKPIVAGENATPAEFFAYVRFSQTKEGKTQSGIFQFGGFVYFASEAHLKAGVPMETMNILGKSDAGTMRFKEGYSTFWQIAVPGGMSKKLIDFPPDSSKEISLRLSNGIMQFSMGIPRTITFSWFGRKYTHPAPAADTITCAFTTKTAGKCTITLTEVLEDQSERVVLTQANMAVSIKTWDKVLPAAGVPGAASSRWFPITRDDFIAAGAKYYTWVQPGELGTSVGGFIYFVEKGGRKALMYFEMLALLCTENAADGLTLYDKWMQKFATKPIFSSMTSDVQAAQIAKPPAKPPNTLVLVIDMQNDFVGMNFQQPCERKRKALVSELREFITARFNEGATIVASLDYHPKLHCGVTGDCDNSHGPFMNYSGTAYDGKVLDDYSYYEGRYINRFPPHCEYFFGAGADKRSAPSEGAKYHKGISGLFYELLAKEEARDRVHTVFKGFNPKKDSFSAIATYVPAAARTEDMAPDAHEEFTGGFALSGNSGTYTPWPRHCYETESKDNLHAPADCFPTKSQLENPNAANNGMFSIAEVLAKIQEQKGQFDRIIVTGLVFDFCVKETAFNAQALFPGKQVIVPIELARPACEGGLVPDFAYKPAGLGTTEIIERTEMEYEVRGIKLVRKGGIHGR
jgi:nicotinamidase-related amidase